VSDIDTGTDHLLGRIDDGVAVLTMNRPERRNALSPEMLSAMARVLADVEVDDEVGCVVLTGAGKGFCAGGDVKSMAGEDGDNGRAAVPYDAQVHRQRLSHRATSGKLHEMPKPTIAALPGAAAGAGLSLALACDLRYAVDTAVMTTAFAKVAYAGDYGGTWFLTQLVGPGKARELYFFSERITAAEGERLGLLNGVFPAETFEADVMAKARQLAAGPRITYRYMKENLNRAIRGEMGECLDMEAAHHIHTGQTQDHHEAARAFVEKRDPVFVNR
jgi:2-(1,2-epoxy-1,2-dihydrophenyl)acetyl-CoA isomerase